MARWSDWKKIRDGSRWCTPDDIYHGPCCYQLGVGGLFGVKPRYIGETSDEWARIRQYATSGSHKGMEIANHFFLGIGTLYYRSIRLATKEEAKRMQDNLLAKDPKKFVWNTQGKP